MKSKPFLPSPRRRAREYAVQSLYQIQINPDILPEQAAKSVYDSIAKDKAAARSALESRDDGAAPAAALAKLDNLESTATELYAAIFFGAHAREGELMAIIRPLLERDEKTVNPIERCVLLMAALELKAMPETPYPVIINEAIEITKTFGGTDSHKFVNSILDKLAAELRPHDPKPKAH